MATSKLNKEQYANLSAFAGVMLVYNSTNKDGELVQTAQHFWGKDFEPADNSDNEIFRVVKNLVATIWHTVAEEKKLREDADGIRSKFRATTPAEIIICDNRNNRIKSTTSRIVCGLALDLCQPRKTLRSRAEILPRLSTQQPRQSVMQ